MPDDCDYGARPGVGIGREPIFAPGLRPATPAGRARKAFGISLSIAWILWPILELATSGAPAWRMVAVYAGVGAWIAIYMGWILARIQEPTDTQNLLLLSVLLAGAVALTVADRPSWAVLFVYCATAGGIAINNDRWAARWIIGCTAVCAVVLFGVLGDPDGIGISLTATTLAIGFLLFSFGRLIRANAALRGAQEELAVRRVDDERLRFARDLHDLLGHDLSVISLKAQLARRLMERDPEAAQRELRDVEDVARHGADAGARGGLRLPPARAGLRAGRRAQCAGRGGHRLHRGARRRVAAAQPGGGPGLGRARGDDERHPPQRGAPLRDPHRGRRRGGDARGDRRRLHRRQRRRATRTARACAAWPSGPPRRAGAWTPGRGRRAATGCACRSRSARWP